MVTRLFLACAMGAAMVLTTNEPSGAQVRSLDDVKKEVLRRAGKINPFNHIRPADAQRIVASLTSLDRDHWAQTWCKVGLDYEAQGDALREKGASGKELADIYYLASDYCRIGRYPVANTPGKGRLISIPSACSARRRSISTIRCRSSRFRSRSRSSSAI